MNIRLLTCMRNQRDEERFVPAPRVMSCGIVLPASTQSTSLISDNKQSTAQSDPRQDHTRSPRHSSLTTNSRPTWSEDTLSKTTHTEDIRFTRRKDSDRTQQQPRHIMRHDITELFSTEL